MIVVGLCGGLDRVDENRFGVNPHSFHDSSCVLLEDGAVVAGIEEERLNRIKHTNKFPLQALRFCLQERGIGIDQVDAFALGVRETYFDEVLRHRYAKDPSCGLMKGRQFLQQLIEREFGSRLSPRRFHFVDHHYAHACSAFYPSRFEESLVLTLDGVGDSLSGTVYVGKGRRLERLKAFPEEDSLGFFYLDVTRYLGYDLFDEYKVMGLAPYGQSDRFLEVFDTSYELLPEGQFRIRRERLEKIGELLPRRQQTHSFSQTDKDVAWALQQSLQKIVLHLLSHYQEKTQCENLCIAGGVGLNCTMNGEILKNGSFKRFFVQPAGHDGGLSLGAALSVSIERQESAAREPVQHLFWGSQCRDQDRIGRLLEPWKGLVDYQRVEDVADQAAQLMEAGHVIGWVQGRSEFGPRALGNRSILADPRPPENKDIINSMVKKREGYRPFAPAVQEEWAGKYFDIPSGTCTEFPFMVFVVDVKEEHRSSLGAITHVDGSARIQTVYKSTNPLFWELIEAFRRRTGVPIVLNTSFNNNAEPIVETPCDAVNCFLTTDLPYLVIGNWVVGKKPGLKDRLSGLRLSLRPYAKLHRNGVPGAGNGAPEPVQGSWWNRVASKLLGKDGPGAEASAPAHLSEWEIGNTFNHWKVPLEEPLFNVLLSADGDASVGDLLHSSGVESAQAKQKLMRKLVNLWERRLVSLHP